jgi:cytochrome b561
MVIIAYVSVGVLILYLVVVGCCYRAVTRPVKGVKNMQDRDDAAVAAMQRPANSPPVRRS